jgi:hypothetical protein
MSLASTSDQEDVTSIESDSISDLQNIEYLHQLLPYDPATRFRKELQTGLKEYQLLLNALLKAIDYFHQGKLEKFDSLVGENACQIRAIYVALLANKKHDFFKLRDEILNVLQIIRSIHFQFISKLIRNKKSLLYLLESKNLLFKLSKDVLFLLESFLLSEAKEKYIEDSMISSLLIRNKANLQVLKELGEVTTSFADNLVKCLRRRLSFDSIQFIREIARNSKERQLMKMVSNEFVKMHNNCFCVPCFWSIKLMLKVIHCEKIPVFVHVNFYSKVDENKYERVDETFLLYESRQTSSGSPILIETSPEKINQDQPIMIIRGAVVVQSGEVMNPFSWKQAMKEYSLDDVILAAAADHRQYPRSDYDQAINSVNDQEYEKYRCLAKNGGFSLDNPSTFFINHIYTSFPMQLPFFVIPEESEKISFSNLTKSY